MHLLRCTSVGTFYITKNVTDVTLTTAPSGVVATLEMLEVIARGSSHKAHLRPSYKFLQYAKFEGFVAGNGVGCALFTKFTCCERPR